MQQIYRRTPLRIPLEGCFSTIELMEVKLKAGAYDIFKQFQKQLIESKSRNSSTLNNFYKHYEYKSWMNQTSMRQIRKKYR